MTEDTANRVSLAQTAATPTAIVGIHSGLIAPPLELSTRGQLNLWPPRTTAARGSVTSGRSEADRRVDLREHRAGHRARPVGAVGEDPLQLSAIGHVLAEPLAQRGDKRLERVGGVGLQRPVLRAGTLIVGHDVVDAAAGERRLD